MFYLLINLCALILLVIFTVSDLKTRTIWWPLAAGTAAMGVLIHFLLPGLPAAGGLTGLLPGGILLLISKVCGEAVGRGDCYVVGALGALTGAKNVTELLFTALLFSAVWGILLMLQKKADRKTPLPFMPFLLAAQLCRMAAGVVKTG